MRAWVGFPRRALQVRENSKALSLLSQVIKKLDATPSSERLELLLRGVFAGNIFDLGAQASTQLYKDGNGTNIVQVCVSEPWSTCRAGG